jgi:hypothetical protein
MVKIKLAEDLQDKYLGRIKEITKNKLEQMKLHQDALLTREFIKGHQWCYLNEYGAVKEIPIDMSYKKIPTATPRPREVVNLMFPIWRTYKSYLIRSRPRIVAKPEDPEEVFDLIGARVATKIMEYLYETLILRKKSDQIFNHQLIYGTCFLHPIWNRDTRKCELKVIPPTQIFIYPTSAHTWNQVVGVAWKRSVVTELLNKQYKRTLETEFKADTDVAEDMEYLNSAGVLEERKENKTNLYDYWEIPYKGSAGVWIRVANNEILESSTKFPYKNKDHEDKYQLPFVPIYDNKLDDSVFGFSTIGLLKSRQMSYNKGKSRLAQLRELTPKLLVDVESKIHMDDIVDEDSTVIEYSSSHQAEKPSYTSVPHINPILTQDIATMPQEIEHQSGFHQVLLRSESIGSIQSGVGIRNLAEQDELRLAPALESLRFGFIKTFEQLYSLVRQYYNEDQVREILGERGEIDLLTFKEIPLNSMTFTIEETTFTPYSQAYKQNLMMQLLPMGLFNMADPKDRKNVYEYLDPTLAMNFSTVTIEERYVKVENKRMLEGEKVPVNPDDVDAVHIDGHNVFIKDVRFRELPNTIKEKFQLHQEEHRVQGQQKMQQQMQMMKEAQGGKGSVPEEKLPQSTGMGKGGM